ncbi:MAG: HD domain-containing protein [Thiotrichales bacterium]|nr:HD domain-containing protein [Thiotrichales bacterium]
MLAAKNAHYFDAEILTEIAGLLHDIGKYTKGFKNRLEGGKRVDHATAVQIKMPYRNCL